MKWPSTKWTVEEVNTRLKDEIKEVHRRHKKRLELIAITKTRVENPGMKPKEKMAAAVKLRNAGKTFREIGTKLGVSTGRAAQLFSLASRLDDHIKKYGGLSNRAVNGLKYRSDESVTDETGRIVPQKVANMGRQKLNRVRDLGLKTFVEIEVWLAGQGLELGP